MIRKTEKAHDLPPALWRLGRAGGVIYSESEAPEGGVVVFRQENVLVPA